MTVPAGAVLPRLLLVTDRRRLPPNRRLVDVVAEAVAAGLRGVLVRERDLEDRERAELVFDVQHRLAGCGGTLLVASPQLGRPDGVHLRRGEPVPRSRPGLLGRSCHDAAEVRRAVADGCDYLTVSPVAPTPSKPGYGPVLGQDHLRRLVGHAGGRAVFALGGVTTGNAATWVRSGAYGVAVSGAVLRARDPATVVAGLCRALTESPTGAPPVRPRREDSACLRR